LYTQKTVNPPQSWFTGMLTGIWGWGFAMVQGRSSDICERISVLFGLI